MYLFVAPMISRSYTPNVRARMAICSIPSPVKGRPFESFPICKRGNSGFIGDKVMSAETFWGMQQPWGGACPSDPDFVPGESSALDTIDELLEPAVGVSNISSAFPLEPPSDKWGGPS